MSLALLKSQVKLFLEKSSQTSKVAFGTDIDQFKVKLNARELPSTDSLFLGEFRAWHSGADIKASCFFLSLLEQNETLNGVWIENPFTLYPYNINQSVRDRLFGLTLKKEKLLQELSFLIESKAFQLIAVSDSFTGDFLPPLTLLDIKRFNLLCSKNQVTLAWIASPFRVCSQKMEFLKRLGRTSVCNTLETSGALISNQ